MEFLKKHYEKILLGAVLLGLAVAAAALPFAIKQAEADLSQVTAVKPQTKIRPPIDMSTNEAALMTLTNPPRLILSGDHNVFNPVVWKTNSEGKFFKFLDVGPKAIKIVKLAPLQYIIAFEKTNGQGFNFMVTRDVAVARLPSRPASRFSKLNEKSVPVGEFILRGVEGPADNPGKFKLEILDTKETVTITRDTPYRKVEGYSADLYYDPDKKSFTDVRTVGFNSEITLGGEIYKVIDITENQIRLQSVSTSKQYTIGASAK